MFIYEQKTKHFVHIWTKNEENIFVHIWTTNEQKWMIKWKCQLNRNQSCECWRRQCLRNEQVTCDYFFLFIFHLNIHTNVHIAHFVRLNIHMNKCTFIQKNVQLIVFFEFKRHFHFLFIFISYWIHILFIFEINIHLYIWTFKWTNILIWTYSNLFKFLATTTKEPKIYTQIMNKILKSNILVEIWSFMLSTYRALQTEKFSHVLFCKCRSKRVSSSNGLCCTTI